MSCSSNVIQPVHGAKPVTGSNAGSISNHQCAREKQASEATRTNAVATSGESGWFVASTRPPVEAARAIDAGKSARRSKCLVDASVLVGGYSAIGSLVPFYRYRRLLKITHSPEKRLRQVATRSPATAHTLRPSGISFHQGRLNYLGKFRRGSSRVISSNAGCFSIQTANSQAAPPLAATNIRATRGIRPA